MTTEWKSQRHCFWRPRPGSLPQPSQCKRIGDLAPAGRDEIAGRIRELCRLEAVRVGAEVPIWYRVRVQGIWQPDVPHGIWGGMKEMSKPLMEISLRAVKFRGNHTKYWVHFSMIGWQEPFKNGMEAISGNKQIQAVLFFEYRR